MCSRLEGKWWLSLRLIGTRLNPRGVVGRYLIRFPLEDGPRHSETLVYDFVYQQTSDGQIDFLSSVKYSNIGHQKRDRGVDEEATMEERRMGVLGKNVKVEGHEQGRKVGRR